ncbi:MAG: alpha/beta hydrolase [Archangium sp.]
MYVALGTLVVGYLAICALVFFVQRSLVFPAPTEKAGTPRGMTEVPVKDGTFMITSMVNGDGPVVVHFHGNGEQVGWLGFIAQEYEERGVSFVAVEYPGYPGTNGIATEEGIMNAAQVALKQLAIPRERLILEGQSVGTGVAVAMAAKGWGSKLILLSPYTALPDVGARVFSWLPVKLLMRDRFDSLSRAGDVKVPTLIVHGRNDDVVPFELGEQLSKSIAGVQFIAVDDAGHNDLWDKPVVVQSVVDFVLK